MGPRQHLQAATATQTTKADFLLGTFSGWGSSVTATGGGDVRLAPAAAELTHNFTSLGMSVLSPALSSHTSVAFNGWLYVVGGSNGSSAQTGVYRAQINSDGTLGSWTSDSSLPAGRQAHAMAVWNSRLYVVGGSDGSSPQTTVYRAVINSDGSLGSWTTDAASLPAARQSAAMAAWNGMLYFSGGNDGSTGSQTTVYRSSINSNGSLGAWTTDTALPAAREAHSMGAWNNTLYVAGGSGQTTVYQTAIAGNGSLINWATTTALPVGSDGHAMTVWGGKLYLAGGLQSGVSTATVYIGIIAADMTVSTWTSAYALTDIRHNLSLTAWDDWLYATGGQSGASVKNTVWRAPINRGSKISSWTAATSLPKAIQLHQAKAYNGRLYVTAGFETNVLASSMVYVADIGKDGSLGSWTALSTPVWNSKDGLTGQSMDFWNDRLYITAGGSSATKYSSVTYHSVNADGTIGVFAKASNSLINRVSAIGAAFWNGYIYIVGGNEAGTAGVATVYRAPILASGDVGAFTAMTSLPVGLTYHDVQIHNGIIYASGGCTACFATPLSSVYMAKIKSDGTLPSVWSTAGNAMPYATNGHRSVIWNNQYAIAGGSNTAVFTSSVTLATLKPDGSPNSWNYQTFLPDQRGRGAMAIWGGRLYYLGGKKRDSVTYANDVWYSGAPQYSSTGTFYGTVFNLGGNNAVSDITWATTAGASGSSIVVYIATAGASAQTLSPWKTITSGAQSGLTAKYLAYRVDFSVGTDSTTTPAFNSIVVTYTPDTTAPGPVGDIAAASVSGSTSSINLTWTAPGDDGYAGNLVADSSFTIQYTSNAATVVWSTANAQIVIDTGAINQGALQSYITPKSLLANTTYFSRIWTQDEAVNLSSGLSNGATVATLALAPTALPTNFLNVYLTSVTANWTAFPTNDVSSMTSEGYSLEAFDTPTFDTLKASSSTPNVVLSTLTVYSPALTPNTTYYFRVGSLNWASALNYANLSATATLANAPLTLVSTFSAVGATQFTASWNGNSNPLTITSYTVQASTASDFNAAASSVTFTTAPVAGPQYTFSSLSPNTTYYFRVRAVNHNGIATDYTALGSTQTLGAAASDGAVSAVNLSSITVTWGAVSADGFRLQGSSTNFGNGLVYMSSTPADSATTLTLSGLEPNTTYYFKLASFNTSLSTNEVVLSSYATLAQQVSNKMLYSVFYTSVTINWTAFPPTPDSATAHGYRLEAATASETGSADFGSPVSSVTYNSALSTLTVSGLLPGTTYAFRVGSLNWGSVAHYAVMGTTMTSLSTITFVAKGGNSNWYNPANWLPARVPVLNDNVLIDLSSSVIVSVSSPPISFFNLTLGRSDGSRASNLTFLSTGIAAGANSITIYNGAGLTQGSTNQIVLDGNFTMFSGSTLTHRSEGSGAAGVAASSVNIKVLGTFDLQVGAIIQVSSAGYTGGVGGGAGAANGNRSLNGGGTKGTAAIGGGGGGYGGAGGAGSGPGGAGGLINGLFANPNSAGSGGGGATAAGGNGGGIVLIDASSISVNGLIDARGANGGIVLADTGGGGGSGGGVNITAAYFSGTGTIDVSGGKGGSGTVDDNGGGGGGGRVAVTISNSGSVCSMSAITIAGGAAGTGFGSAVAGANGSSTTTGGVAVPSNFTGTPQSASSILWTWNLAVGATDYQVFSTTGATQFASPMSPALGQASSYTTNNLLPNTTAVFFVQARSCGANNNFSSNASVATLAAEPTAAAPAFGGVNITSFTVYWSTATNPISVTTYTVALSTEIGYPNSHAGNVTLSTMPAGVYPAATLTALSPNTTYFLSVSAKNHAGAATNYAALGSTASLANVPLTVVTTFTAVNASGFTVNWEKNSNPLTITSYTVVVSTDPNFTALFSPYQVSYVTAPAGGPQFAFTGLNSSTLYYFQVRAVNHNNVATAYVPLGSVTTAAGGTVGITITGDPYDFESVALNTTTHSTRAITVTNSGSVSEDYTIYANTITTNSPWTLAQTTNVAAGFDRFLLKGAFYGSLPTSAQFDGDYWTVISTSPRLSSAASYTVDGAYTGAAVPASGARSLWFKFSLPTATSLSVPPAQQSIRITVVADQSP